MQTPEEKIRRKLKRTAMFVRWFTAVRTGLLVLFCLELLVWTSLGIDFLFTPSQEIRVVLLVLGVVTLCAVAIRPAFSLLFHPLTWYDLARIHERRIPELGESLLTVVTDDKGSWGYANRKREEKDHNQLHQEFVSLAAVQSAKILEGVRVASVFNWTNLVALAGGVLLLMVLTIVTGLEYRSTARLWFSRMVCLSDERPPARTTLLLDGADERNEFCVRQGDPFELRVLVNSRRGKAVREIQVAMIRADGTSETLPCRRFREEITAESNGKAEPRNRNATCRVFTVNFASILSSMNLTIRGGDAQTVCLIRAIKPPGIVSATVRQTFPDYMNRPEWVEPAGGIHTVPEGTSLLFAFESDKTLRQIAIEPETAATVQRDASRRTCFTVATGKLTRWRQFDICITDEDGITPREPLGFRIGILPDRSPVVKGSIRGVGRRITPFALIPYSVSVVDDYGINSIFISVRKGNVSPWESMKLSTLAPSEVEYAAQGTFDAALLPLKPGDLLSIRIAASDFKPVRDGNTERFQTGLGPVWDFEIVDPAQLKESLEVEEYGYRDRLVNLIRQTEQTKNLASGTTDSSGDRTVSGSRVLRDLHKNMFDAVQIARGITGLCDEIRNNRLSRTQEESRDPFDITRLRQQSQLLYLPGHLEELRSQVAASLESLVEKEFAPLCERLAVSNPAPGNSFESTRSQTIATMEKILDGLNDILGHMRSLQSFRELVDEFRKIRREIQQTQDATYRKKDELFHELEK